MVQFTTIKWVKNFIVKKASFKNDKIMCFWRWLRIWFGFHSRTGTEVAQLVQSEISLFNLTLCSLEFDGDEEK